MKGEFSVLLYVDTVTEITKIFKHILNKNK